MLTDERTPQLVTLAEEGPKLEPTDAREVAASTLALAQWLERLGARRYLCRFFQSISFSITISETLLCWLSDNSREGLPIVAHWLSKTLYFSLVLSYVAAFAATTGIVDAKTRRFVTTMFRRRGMTRARMERLESGAIAIWLIKLVGLPIVAVSLVSLARAPSLQIATSLLSLGFGSLLIAVSFVLLIAITLHSIRKAQHPSPRWLWLTIALGPELLRLFDPQLPTLRTLLETLPPLLLECSL